MLIECFTIATDAKYQNLQRSNKEGLRITNLGLKKTGEPKTWKGWRWRMKKYRKACQRALHADLVVLMDAYDVLVVPGAPQKLQGLYHFMKEGQHDIVIGAESYLMPNFTDISKYHASMPCKTQGPCIRSRQLGRMKWAQAGVIAGRPQAMFDMFDWILQQEPLIMDDQAGIGLYMNEALWPKVYLDSTGLLVNNVWGLDTLRVWSSQFTGAFAHFPGFLTKYGLNLSYRESSWAFSDDFVGLTSDPFFDSRKLFCALLVLIFSFVFWPVKRSRLLVAPCGASP